MKSFVLLVLGLLGCMTPYAQSVQLTITKIDPACKDYTNGQATANATGGIGSYTYAWSNGQSTKTIYGLSDGTVSVTVTDAQGASAIGSVTLTEPDELVASVVPQNVGCSSIGGTLSGAATGGTPAYTYIWSTGANEQTIPAGSNGTKYVTVTDNHGCTDVATFNVDASEIIFNYEVEKPTCSGGNDGAINYQNVFGNNPPFSYVWPNGSSSSSYENLSAGTYNVTVTDGNGCTLVQPIEVQDRNPIWLDLESTDAICAMACDGVAKVGVYGGVGPYTVSWSNGSTQAIQSSLPPGVYCVTATDALGCTETGCVTIYEPGPISINVTNITAACGDNGSITVQATGGNMSGGYTYTWSNGHVGPTLSNVPAGTYWVNVEDIKGCEKDLAVVLPGAPAVDVNLIVQSALCNGQPDGKVTAVATGGSGTYVSYEWNLPGMPNSTTISGLAAGTVVTVTVTDSNGCTGTATATVGAHTQVTIAVDATDVVCPDDLTGSATATAANGTAPYTYVWTMANGTTFNGPTVSGLSAGAYQVVATDANGCTSISAANINSTDGLSAAYDVEVQNCVAGGINISFSDNSQNAITWAWNIAWSTGSQQFNVQNPGVVNIPAGETATIQLTTTSLSGCTASISNQLNTTNLGLSTSIATVNAACVGVNNGTATVIVGGGTNYTYLWDNGAVTPSIDGLAAGDSVSVVVTDVSGCGGTASAVIGANTAIEVTVIDVAPSVCGNTNTGTATATSATPGLTYTWNLGGATFIGATINTFPGTYVVTATDAAGCLDTTTAVIGLGTGVEVAITPLAAPPCVGEEFTVTANNLIATDVVSYHWFSATTTVSFDTPDAATTTVTGTAQGSYNLFLAVVNQNGCRDTLSYEVGIGVSGALAPAITMDLCKGVEVRFNTGIAINGTWSFGDTNTSSVNDTTYTYGAPGTYTVSFTPSVTGCVLPFDTTITTIAPACFTPAFNQDLQSCENAATFLMTSTSTACNAITGYAWSFQPQNITSNEQNPTISFPISGSTTAQLILTDTFGCKDTTSTTFPFAIVTESVDATQNFCPDANGVALNPVFDINYTYAWTATPNDSTLNASSPNPTVNPTVPTTYTVVIKNGGCEVTKTVTVTPDPAAQLTDPADQLVCTNTPVALTASSTNGTIRWADNPNFNNPTAGTDYTVNSPVRNGVYYVQATTPAGCITTNEVIVNNASVAITYPNSANLCKDSQGIPLPISNQYPSDILTYDWNNGLPPISNPSVNPTSTTVYNAIVTNQFGCKDTASITVNVSQLAVSALAMKDTICPGQSTTITATATGAGSYTYNWEPSSSVISGVDQATATVQPTETKEFTVVVTDEFGCSESATATVAFMELFCRDPYVFVPSAFTPDGNGNNDRFFVRGYQLKEVYFTVYDRWGEKMFETYDPNSPGWDGTYKGQKLTADSYGWYCRVKCVGGDDFECKGNVTLLK